MDAKYGLQAPNRAKHAPKGGIERERLTELVGRGMTIAELAVEVGRSQGTVRHWLRRYNLSTQHHRGRRPGSQTADAKVAGLLTITMNCPHHGDTDFWLEGRGAYRCKRCRAEAVTRRRRTVKAILVEEAGGRCVICGYDRYVGSLQFHHIDPSLKRIALSAAGIAFAIDRLRAEASKCVLLCSNCHAEVEGGVTTLPLHLRLVPDDALHPNPG